MVAVKTDITIKIAGSKIINVVSAENQDTFKKRVPVLLKRDLKREPNQSTS